MKTKLLLLLLLATFSIYAQQYTPIPDINFENKLIALNIDSGVSDGKVLTSSITGIAHLNLYNSSISDLTGIEDFTSLTNLNARKNKLTSINLSKNTKLTDLNVSENKLTDLDIKTNTLLTKLDCQRNMLTDLNVSENTKLTDLNVMVNQLSSLDLTNNLVLDALTSSSNKLTSLNINNNTLLTEINCGNNLLTSLNISTNTLLTVLACNTNQITSLNVSNNKLLVQLMCHFNNLTAIDVSNNPELEMFDCLNNQITSIDISKNPKITELACENNQLTYLNLKNGNNVILELPYSNFINNPNLSCIQVDDITYSNTNWSTKKDVTATYSTTCNTLGLEEAVFDKATVYPNPTKGELHINNVFLDKATVYNSLGQLVKTFTLNSNDINNAINLSGLPKGIYYVYLINQDSASAKKVIIE
ncbi:T9SS type A sorting domain-containing protein [Flavobacterium sp. 140616W15]|uniref:T9SS type A sorting domain-containing protein n=1 Tax=Flavobacterium sp. 140616W15 TaxID=2478552 RepID=UPI000F0CC769|nr:T9SS type A sorting domain-containing protein [Flavobacterium sp. 140616W15]AYN05665.1 T9SS C-terminal target domain-containing protein [Flavobacterium sp. 140616W15]